MKTISQVNNHHTKFKGDQAAAFVNFHLVSQGFYTFLPTSENCEYDIIVDTGSLWRIQVKMVSRGNCIPYVTSWSDRKGHHRKRIDSSRFDIFAIVNEDCDRIAFCLPEMAGKTIAWEHPSTKQSYYWWEDFKELRDDSPAKITTPGFTTIVWPNREELTTMVENSSYNQVARDIGCSPANVRRHLNKK